MEEFYSEIDMNAVDSHIGSHFGTFENVFHEIVSPDIHVDICQIRPTRKRNYHTLVTMGMGAHRMNVPPEFGEYNLERAEFVITLPPDWKFSEGSFNDESNYWPLRWLKIMARLPIEQDTWLSWGHTVPNGEPFAGNTELCGMLVSMPYFFGEKAALLHLPNGEVVNFYQLVPLYENEMQYKIENGAQALEDRFPDNFDMVVDVDRKNLFAAAPKRKSLFKKFF